MTTRIDPLDILEHMAVHAEDERTKVTAAKALAEYTHAKVPPQDDRRVNQEVNIVMLISDEQPKGPRLV